MVLMFRSCSISGKFETFCVCHSVCVKFRFFVLFSCLIDQENRKF